MAALTGGAVIEQRDDIAIEAPALAEDGAVVPVTVTARLPGVEVVHLIGEKNPVPLIASFEFGPGMVDGRVSTRIKLAESSRILVLVQASGRLYANQRFVEVTKGGCT